MTLKQFTDYLKGVTTGFNKYYVNTIDDTRENVLGVYNGAKKRISDTRFKALHKTKDISLLVTGSKNSVATEKLAQDLYDVLYNSSRVSELSIDYIQLHCDEPIFIGATDHGLFQFVIELTIYYKLTF